MKTSARFFLISTILLSFCFNSYACLPAARQSHKYTKKHKLAKSGASIKVLLATSGESITYHPAIDCNVLLGEHKIGKAEKKSSIVLKPHQNEVSVTLNEIQYSDTLLTLVSVNDDEFIQYGSKKYRGSLSFGCDKNQLFIVNELPLEDYLCGVLPVELGNSETKNIETAIDAFAIVARTFAIQKSTNKNRFFNIEASTNAQVYSGVSVEKPVFNDAIKRTEGEVLTYDNEIAQLFYSACCGGVTEDANNVFNKKDIPYLTSHEDGDPANCSSSPAFAWKEEYTANQFKQYVCKKDETQKEIVDVKVTKTFPSGRVSELTVEFGDGTAQKITAKNIRQTIRRASNGAILKSSLFEVETKTTDGVVTKIILTGKGNGHGVGLCQWGSFAMAKKGSSAKEILSFYFPGTQIKDIDD